MGHLLAVVFIDVSIVRGNAAGGPQVGILIVVFRYLLNSVLKLGVWLCCSMQTPLQVVCK